MRTEQQEKLALGIFMPNCSNMPSISTHRVVEDQWTYEHNEAIALAWELLPTTSLNAVKLCMAWS